MGSCIFTHSIYVGGTTVTEPKFLVHFMNYALDGGANTIHCTAWGSFIDS
jgi:hypothetical protein